MPVVNFANNVGRVRYADIAAKSGSNNDNIDSGVKDIFGDCSGILNNSSTIQSAVVDGKVPSISFYI